MFPAIAKWSKKNNIPITTTISLYCSYSDCQQSVGFSGLVTARESPKRSRMLKAKLGQGAAADFAKLHGARHQMKKTISKFYERKYILESTGKKERFPVLAN